MGKVRNQGVIAVTALHFATLNYQDSIFKDEVEMDIVKTDKSVCKNFNKAKELSSHFSFLSNI